MPAARLADALRMVTVSGLGKSCRAETSNSLPESTAGHGVADGVELGEGETLGVGDADVVLVVDGDAVLDGVPLGVGDSLGLLEMLALGVTLGVTLELGEAPVVIDGVGEGLRLCVGVTDADGLALDCGGTWNGQGQQIH